MKAAIRLTGGDLKTALSRALSARLVRRSMELRESGEPTSRAGRGGGATDETTEGGSHGQPGE